LRCKGKENYHYGTIALIWYFSYHTYGTQITSTAVFYNQLQHRTFAPQNKTNKDNY